MARPVKEGMDYFPHDTNASNDKKIEALRAIYGNDGYAFYFIMLEQIYQEPNFELLISDAETREEMLQILSRKTAVTPERFIQILNTAIKWDCFDKELYDSKGVLTSNGIKKRAGVVLEKRQKMRIKYQQSKEGISDAETTQETREETPQRKVKIKESKLLYGEFAKLTPSEYTKLCDRFGKEVTDSKIESLDNWLPQGSNAKKRTDHYRTLLEWLKKDTAKPAETSYSDRYTGPAVVIGRVKELE